MDTLDFVKIKNVCFSEDNIKKMKRQATDQKNIDNALISPKKICIQNIKNSANLIRKQKKRKLIKVGKIFE